VLTVSELRSISAARLEDAQALYDSSHYDGVVYLCGYAVELALKARICETLNWNGYPATNREFRDYQTFRTHDLKVLLRLSGHESRILEAVPDDWRAVSNWTPELRYRPPGSASRSAAATLLEHVRQVLESI